MSATFDAYGHGAARVVSCPLAARAVARRNRSFEAATLGINHFESLLSFIIRSGARLESFGILCDLAVFTNRYWLNAPVAKFCAMK